MTILTVLTYPDKKLRDIADPVTVFDAQLHATIDDLFETMYAEKGVGLAATQVAIKQRLVVIDVSEERDSPLCIINPEIMAKEDSQYEYEGCLSVPEAYDKVERAANVKLKALDKHGQPFELEAEGLLAICIQHELDHLNGILFVDHLSRLKQLRLRKKMDKLTKLMSSELE
jgi:peptide deformylase